ncbi:SDR family oxidoreductase [Chelativorans salis]|uniref:SDR family oxidoreductase n=1 Tax=Chelativorans salis TaxID=2978478 RepID=A0ABT2LVV5_9HYPH|nr:SDR family oxidoreductase [Chelativorans sp. EGI FJ00035]MCT7378671.1 SDR family oxidoreductase [Chelativorans sp. EGI FJ00035]
MDAGRLSGKIALVTGAGRGIGEAIARAFAREGASVVVAERDAATGARVAHEIGGLFVETDVTVQAQVEGVVKAAEERYGRVDVLVNNAGANVFHRPHEMPRSEWARCMALDLEACWAMAEAVLPGMRARGNGAIVNIASCHSFKIIPHTFPYPVAKHGLVGLTRALGIEYAGEGIRVNAIAPGYIDTQIARDYWAGFVDPAAERAKAEALHPPGRIGTPEEVAMTCVFLASDEAPFINAETIVIDGGRSALYHD